MSDGSDSDESFIDQGDTNNAGTNLDLATQEFLDETRSTRVLQMKASATGEFALTVFLILSRKLYTESDTNKVLDYFTHWQLTKITD